MDELSHVFNNDLPNVPETYVHRIGRTGRAGHSGVAVSFCSAEERPLLKDIQKLIGKSIPVVEDHAFVSEAGMVAQKEAEDKMKAKARENKPFRGSRSNGDFWRRRKREAVTK